MTIAIRESCIVIGPDMCKLKLIGLSLSPDYSMFETDVYQDDKYNTPTIYVYKTDLQNYLLVLLTIMNIFRFSIKYNYIFHPDL